MRKPAGPVVVALSVTLLLQSVPAAAQTPPAQAPAAPDVNDNDDASGFPGTVGLTLSRSAGADSPGPDP
jgi:hypothetical protein